MVLVFVLADEVENVAGLDRLEVLKIYLTKDRLEYLRVYVGFVYVFLCFGHLALV